MAVVRVRRRPVEVFVVLWTGNNAEEIINWTSGDFRPFVREENGYSAEVYDSLHDTWVKMRVGDRVVRGSRGEYYPIQPDAFNLTYENF